VTFSTPDNLSNNAGNSFEPQISSTSTSQEENSNSEIQVTNPGIQMTNPTQQQTVSAAAFQQQQQQQPGEDSPIMTHQGTEKALSALEKTTKLKQQWLELLP